ncbi:DUF4116 domain-containing protein [Endozoicomonas sp. ISHI1]|uniref:DUF4116 domain-containing protein n=1 Tax=Endozoicomonas sp. ISHI1 TaxID=2825882 RepID=UPI0035A000E0
MSVVTQSGIGLQYASEEMQDDDEVVMTAIDSHPRAFYFASLNMKVPVYRQYGSNGQQGAAKSDKVLPVDGGVDFGF